MEKHEVVIVGAGPGGLKAAKTLEEEGKEDILLVEALPKERIGDKFCGGMVPPRAIETIQIPEKLINTVLNRVSLHIDGMVINVPLQTKWLKRIDLGQYQLSLLKRTEVRDNTKVKDIYPKENYIVTADGDQIAYSYLIDGSGFKSQIKTKVAGKTENYWQCSGYMIKTKNPVDDAFHFYVYTDMNSISLFWSLPYKDLFEVTVAYPMYGSIDKEKAKQHLKEIAESKGLSLEDGEPKAAPVPWDYKGFKFGNVFLLGDAAGVASTIIGDGIYQSAKCGEIAARTIARKDYNWERELNNLLKRYYIGPGAWLPKVYKLANVGLRAASLLTSKINVNIPIPGFIGRISGSVVYNW